MNYCHLAMSIIFAVPTFQSKYVNSQSYHRYVDKRLSIVPHKMTLQVRFSLPFAPSEADKTDFILTYISKYFWHKYG